MKSQKPEGKAPHEKQGTEDQARVVIKSKKLKYPGKHAKKGGVEGGKILGSCTSCSLSKASNDGRGALRRRSLTTAHVRVS